MPKQTVLTIGGVPEHFNLPWHLAIEEGRFADVGIDLRWIDCPGGTGDIARGLAEGRLDLALPLSEGAIAAIARGVPMRILQWYVRSPLIWGIHVPAGSEFQSVDALRGRRFAISRYGSGSHLMAFVAARQRGWNPDEDLCFVEVGDLKGAIAAFENREADGFLWERFTTQPYVDQGLMRRVGECPTPWPAFALAVSERLAEESPDLLAAVGAVINEICSEMEERPDIVAIVASRYGLARQQAGEWFGLTEWASDATLSRSALRQIIGTLDDLGLLERPVTPERCCVSGCRFSD
ncbi:substrate-binding domain-containing protein [Wenzhouxiangella marina]|uniref:ABC transporter substrate-binding protein n=1 Tax=Wenzhouxiangella marina TaxID=1579979 RepID=A0A0K0XVV2_9GAMM|nr:substrate-binding domain-containing protein [Wenzhouxiangella marina]AKS41752.1 ABC transporter substrate-binding protein [Wenzhouxiangella marina]MBB6086486.1 ABC-type nitrate/sulfonate/bicarbonate transport system substrate-binding protein [Wenzhouxiangella marina]